MPDSANNAINRLENADVASLLLKLWGIRTEQFGGESHELDEASWNILLDLFVSDRIGRPVVASDLSYAYEVRKSTMLRRLDYLAQTGLIIKQPDQTNKARVLLSLSEKGHGLLSGALTIIGGAMQDATRE